MNTFTQNSNDIKKLHDIHNWFSIHKLKMMWFVKLVIIRILINNLYMELQSSTYKTLTYVML